MYYTKGQRKRENIVVETKLRQRRKKYFWKISKTYFAFKTQILCLQHMLHAVANEAEHFGNTEALTLNVSRLRAKAAYSEDVEFASRKQKCFASFPFAPSPMEH